MTNPTPPPRLDYAEIISAQQDQLDALRRTVIAHHELFERLVAQGVLPAGSVSPRPERD